jgi:orotate phosphoribosyltransferase
VVHRGSAAMIGSEMTESEMTGSEIGQRVALLLLNAGAIHISRQQPFILAAGWASPVYVDCRLLIAQPAILRAITALSAAYCATAFPAGSLDAIAGAETGGIPFATCLAEQCGLELRYVRKRPLGIGRNAQVEGGPVEGLRLLLMDDLTTDGASKLAFVRGLRSAGAVVEHVLTIFYHNAFAGALERLEQANLRLHALATWTDVLQGVAGERLAPQERAVIESFLADPVAWSTRHGGRVARSARG